MRLKQKIMIVRQLALARSTTNSSMEVSRKTTSASTNDESNFESPIELIPRDLLVKVEANDIRRRVKMEEMAYVEKKQSSELDWTPEEYEENPRVRKSTQDKILVKKEYGSVSGKSEFKTPPTKNIAINYGKAMVTFATSHIAIPYIQSFIKDNNVDFQGFIVFVKAHKNKVKSMMGIRSMVNVEDRDDATLAGYKRLFQKICEIFLKDFSVNWIIHSKLDHKLVYLKWRMKMLRRVQYPKVYASLGGLYSP